MSLLTQVEFDLTMPEQEQLVRLEETIERGLQSFVEVGTALLVIRESKLYRQTHATFEAYCRERWAMGKSRVYQMIDAADVVGNLQKSTIVDFPATETQARPLAKLEPEQQREAWAKAVETAPDGKVTAAHVQQVVDKYKDIAADLPADPDEYDSDEWYTPVEFIEAAREVMGGISLDPASSHEAQKVVQARTYYTLEDDGLAQQWTALTVWLNPPYSAPRPWVEKLIESLEAGSVESAIVLVNTANSPLWTRPLWHGPYTVCLLERRVRFWRPDRQDAKGFDRDQMIWYLGSDDKKFRAVFAPYGAIR